MARNMQSTESPEYPLLFKSLSLTERPERSALKTEWTQKWGDFFACYYMNRSHAMVSFS